MAIQVGKPFPDGKFPYIEYTEDSADVKSCGIPAPLDTAKEFKGKTVVLVRLKTSPLHPLPGSEGHLSEWID